METNRATQTRRSPFGAQVALARAATGLGGMGLGALVMGATAVGALAIGALAIRKLAIKRGRIERLDIGELDVGRLRVGELLVVEQEQTPRRGARDGSLDEPAAHPKSSWEPLGAKEVEQGRQEARDDKKTRRKGSDPPRVAA